MPTTRRQLLKNGAVVISGAAALNSRRLWASAPAPSARLTIVPSLATFDYSEVELLDGPLKEQFDRNHDVFLHLNEDAMLKPFREREGMPAPGPNMGGWYDNADDFSPPEN